MRLSLKASLTAMLGRLRKMFFLFATNAGLNLPLKGEGVESI
jgi:hypothetical protein